MWFCIGLLKAHTFYFKVESGDQKIDLYTRGVQSDVYDLLLDARAKK